MMLQAPHCPACGAPVEIPEFATRASCSFCSMLLIVAGTRVSTQRVFSVPVESEEKPPARMEQPDATLWTKQVPFFEMSVIEQKIPAISQERFVAVELERGRFAFVLLRAVDREHQPIEVSLAPAENALLSSLEADGDPGLSANLALGPVLKVRQAKS